MEIYNYCEPVGRMKDPQPVACAIRTGGRTLTVTVPGQLVSNGLAVAPEDRESDVTSTWAVKHVSSGLSVAPGIKCFVWAVECAERLAALDVPWQAPADRVRQVAETTGEAVAIIEEYWRRERELDDLALGGTRVEKQRVRRELKRMGCVVYVDGG